MFLGGFPRKCVVRVADLTYCLDIISAVVLGCSKSIPRNFKSEPAQGKWFSQTHHTYKPYRFAWVDIFMKHILNVMTSQCWVQVHKMEAMFRHDHGC